MYCGGFNHQVNCTAGFHPRRGGSRDSAFRDSQLNNTQGAEFVRTYLWLNLTLNVRGNFLQC